MYRSDICSAQMHSCRCTEQMCRCAKLSIPADGSHKGEGN